MEQEPKKKVVVKKYFCEKTHTQKSKLVLEEVKKQNVNTKPTNL